MKNLRTAVLCACMACLSVGSKAQDQKIPINEPNYNKPKLFTGLPDKMQVNTSELESMFTSTVGEHMSMQLPTDVASRFEGDLVSLSSRSAEGLQTVVIRSTNFPGARLTVSRREVNGQVVYTGRIISFQHGDLYELQNQQGQWFLVKRNYYDLINE
jgi:hypothetical protein